MVAWSFGGVLLGLHIQGKIAPVEAARLVEQGNLCVVVKPEEESRRVTVSDIVWGSGLRPGSHIFLKGYVDRDYVGGPNGPRSDFMVYGVDDPVGGSFDMSRRKAANCSLVFLTNPPRGLSLGPDERFALLPMIRFINLRHDCWIDFNGRLAVGGVLFSSSMKHLHRSSVSLDEVIGELKRIRTGLSSRRRG